MLLLNYVEGTWTQYCTEGFSRLMKRESWVVWDDLAWLPFEDYCSFLCLTSNIVHWLTKKCLVQIHMKITYCWISQWTRWPSKYFMYLPWNLTFSIVNFFHWYYLRWCYTVIGTLDFLCLRGNIVSSFSLCLDVVRALDMHCSLFSYYLHLNF